MLSPEKSDNGVLGVESEGKAVPDEGVGIINKDGVP